MSVKDTVTPQQKKMLIDWANICNEKKQIDLCFSVVLQYEDDIAIVEFDKRKERTDLASGLEFAKMLKSFVDLNIIKFPDGFPLAQCYGLPCQMFQFLYKFTSENAPRELILKLQNI